METIRIYRVENFAGRGPYGLNIYEFQEMEEAHCDERHPNLFFDFGLWNAEDLVFAFPDISNLKNWFSGYENVLKFREYSISVYEIKKNDFILGKSGKQLIFDKKTAIFIETLEF